MGGGGLSSRIYRTDRYMRTHLHIACLSALRQIVEIVDATECVHLKAKARKFAFDARSILDQNPDGLSQTPIPSVFLEAVTSLHVSNPVLLTSLSVEKCCNLTVLQQHIAIIQ